MIKPDMAHKIFDILVEECGASEDLRSHFVHTQSTVNCKQFRFQGDLGYHGKLYVSEKRWYVDCAVDDLSNPRYRIIEKANCRLNELKRTIKRHG